MLSLTTTRSITRRGPPPVCVPRSVRSWLCRLRLRSYFSSAHSKRFRSCYLSTWHRHFADGPSSLRDESVRSAARTGTHGLEAHATQIEIATLGTLGKDP